MGVQDIVVSVDSVKLLEQYLKLAMATALHSTEELAVKAIDYEKMGLSFHLPPAMLILEKYFPVVFISGDYSPMYGKQNSFFNGRGPWETLRSDGKTNAVSATIKYLKKLLRERGPSWEKQFKNKFGIGYDDSFNELDGSVRVGYEIRTCGCFPEWLAISLVHFRYGK